MNGPDTARWPAGLALAIAFALMAGCAGVPAAKEEAPKGDPIALGVVAEIALQKGDCKTASETYVRAAQVSADPALARHAYEVANKCAHLPAAWQAVSRWHALAPNSGEADARYAYVAVQLYRLPEAREAVNQFSHAPPPPPPPTKAVPGITGKDAGPAAGGNSGEAPSVDVPSATARPGGKAEDRPLLLSLTALTALLLEKSDASTVLSAMSSTLESTKSPEATALLSELALGAYDAQRAERYAQEALQHNPKDPAALLVLARSYVVRGDAAKAIATAREAVRDNPEQSPYDLVDVLIALDRMEDAHQELERLRSQQPAGEIDRRLALLAYDAGDMKEARQRFAELASSGEGNEAALLYLAD